jgi:hypothetical protein
MSRDRHSAIRDASLTLEMEKDGAELALNTSIPLGIAWRPDIGAKWAGDLLAVGFSLERCKSHRRVMMAFL